MLSAGLAAGVLSDVDDDNNAAIVKRGPIQLENGLIYTGEMKVGRNCFYVHFICLFSRVARSTATVGKFGPIKPNLLANGKIMSLAVC